MCYHCLYSQFHATAFDRYLSDSVTPQQHQLQDEICDLKDRLLSHPDRSAFRSSEMFETALQNQAGLMERTYNALAGEVFDFGYFQVVPRVGCREVLRRNLERVDRTAREEKERRLKLRRQRHAEHRATGMKFWNYDYDDGETTLEKDC